MKKMTQLLLASTIATASAGVAPVSYGAMAIEEIIVLARKRQESVQDIPVAVTAVTPEQLERAAIVNLEDATALTPGFTTQPSSVSPTSPALSMRGSTQTDQLITADPSVGVYLDGVYIARTYGIGVDLLDLASIEVLKGPQGTLFGRNSTAGAMLVKTHDPVLEEFSGQASLTAGDEDARHGFIVNIPIGEKLAIRGAYQKNDREDYITNLANDVKPVNTKIGGYTNESARVKIRFAPTDSLDMVLSYEEFETDVSGPAREQTWLSGEVVNADKDDDKVSLSFDPRSYADTETLSFVATHTGDYGELKFTYSDREWRDLRFSDYDGGELAVDPTINARRRHSSFGRQAGDQESYELQFTTSLFDDRVDWVVGITYFEEFAQLYDYSMGGFGVTPGNLNSFMAFFGHDLGGSFGGGSYVDQDLESLGVYSQANIKITDQTNLTFGLRYTKDEKSAFISGNPASSSFTIAPSWDFDAMVASQVSTTSLFGAPLAPTPTESPSEEWTSTDWLISLDHQLNEDVLLYAKASTGFRAGGFNGRGVPAGSIATLEYDPEETLEFELGLKAEFLDGRLRWNTAVYFNETDDKQFTTIFQAGGGTGTAIRNAGKAEAQGFETEFTYLLSENWSLSGSWSYIDLSIAEFVDDYDGDGVFTARPDFLLPIAQFVPENEFSLSLAYDQDFDKFSLAGSFTYHWIDEMPGNDKSVEVVSDEIAPYGLTMEDAQEFVDGHTSDAYGRANLSLTASDLDDRYSATFWVRNVFDERAAQSGIGFVAGANYQYSTLTWTEPRTMGVTLKVNF